MPTRRGPVTTPFCPATPGHHLNPRQVSRVIWAPDGTVLLDFEVDGFVNDPSAQAEVLEDAGYQEL